MRKNISLVSFVCLPLLACGGSDSNSKSVKVVDAKTYNDAPASLCGAGSSYASLGNMGFAVDEPAHTGSNGSAVSRTIFAGTTLGSATVASGLLLIDGAGVFASGIKAGTYPISGQDASFSTCDLCFFIQAGANKGTTIGFTLDGTGGDFYQAISGSIVFSAIGANAGSGSGHNLSGTISNIVFQKVDLTTGNPSADGCTTTVGSGGWGYDLQAQGSARTSPKTGITEAIEAKLSNRSL